MSELEESTNEDYFAEAEKHIERWVENTVEKAENAYFKVQHIQEMGVNGVLVERTYQPDAEDSGESSEISRYWGFNDLSSDIVREWVGDLREEYDGMVDLSRTGYGGIELD